MPPNKAREAQRVERRAKVAQLLRASVPVYRIAERLGIDPRTATSDVNYLLDLWAQEQKPEDRHRWRARELAKLDEIEIQVAANARKGHEGAVDRVLRIMERRARFLGLDAPAKQEVDLRNIDKLIEAELERITGRKTGASGAAAHDAGYAEAIGAGEAEPDAEPDPSD